MSLLGKCKVRDPKGEWVALLVWRLGVSKVGSRVGTSQRWSSLSAHNLIDKHIALVLMPPNALLLGHVWNILRLNYIPFAECSSSPEPPPPTQSCIPISYSAHIGFPKIWPH